MLRYIKKYWIFCILAPLFMLGEISMDLIQPSMMATIVDEGVLKQNMDLVLSMGIRMILLVLFGGFCGILCGVFANLASQQFANDLRKDLFAKIMNLSFAQTEHFTTGSLITRLVSDVTQIQQMVGLSVRGVVRSSSMFIGGILMLYLQSPKFALVAACGLPFILFLVSFFLKKASPMFTVVQEKLDNVNNCLQETLAGARVVKAYVREEHELARFDETNQALCGTNLRVQTLLAFLTPCMNIVLNLCVVMILSVGGYSVRTGADVSSGQIMAAITYMALILHSITFMANIFQTFTRASASAKRVNQVLHCEDDRLGDLPDEIAGERAGSPASPCGAKDVPEFRDLTFSHVSFSYPGYEQPVLEDISFCIRKGETLGIIGATGSGKSSLAGLIPRFYDVTDGAILWNGTDIRRFPVKNLREQIAVAMQRAELYSRPIEANIRFGKPDVTPFEIKSAATVAQADDFICQSPEGYYTFVTESGHSLSGGQKQRISIARAVLKNAKLLIFDDTTNALDLKTESLLYQALGSAYPHTAKIIIAQRIASIQNADNILVLDGGRIVASGTHRELLAASTVYREICQSQLKEDRHAI